MSELWEETQGSKSFRILRHITFKTIWCVNCHSNTCKPMDTQNQEVALPTTSSIKLNLQFGNLFPCLTTDTHTAPQHTKTQKQLYTHMNTIPQHKWTHPFPSHHFHHKQKLYLNLQYIWIYSICNIRMQKSSNAPLWSPVKLHCRPNSIQFFNILWCHM